VSSRLHAQFETIHPLLDGSGGVGRLLITLILAGEKALACPLLYVSLFFEQHRSEYDERLQRIRSHGDWESWIVFYLTGIREVSTQGAETAGRIVRLFDEDSGAILDSDGGVHSMTRLFDPSKRKMYVSVPEAVEKLGLTAPKGASAIERLVTLGVVDEVNGTSHPRMSVHSKYLTILAAGTSVDS
jgi:Fic family protein